MFTISVITDTENNSPIIRVLSFLISIASCGEILIDKNEISSCYQDSLDYFKVCVDTISIVNQIYLHAYGVMILVDT